MLLLQVSNVGVLEQAKAFPFYRCIQILLKKNIAALLKKHVYNNLQRSTLTYALNAHV